MGISGRRETFQQGRLDNVDLKFSNSRWEMVEGKQSGKDTARFLADMIDADGNEHPWNWVALGGTGKRGSGLSVVDDKLVIVNEDGDEVEEGGLSDGCGAAKLFDALQDLGFSPKKLDKVGDDPSVLDDSIWHFEQRKSGRKSDDGKEFSDLLPTAAVDEEDFGSGGGSKAKAKAKTKSKAVKEEEEEEEEERPTRRSSSGSSKGKGTSGKARAADRDEEEEEESDESAADEGGDDDGGDPIVDQAVEAMERILADPGEFVTNFNPKKNDGGLTLKEVYLAGVSAIKGKTKGEACNLLRDAKFHRANAKAGLYLFDAENGIVSAKPKKGGKR